MKNNRPLNLSLLITAAAIATSATNAIGVESLALIPTVGSDTVNEARAITPDGAYVVGVSGPYSISADTGNAFLYRVGSGTLNPTPMIGGGAVAHLVTGVGYRYDGGVQQLIVDGWSGGWHADWATPDAGVTWYQKRRDSNVGTTANNAACSQNSLAGTATDAFYATFRDDNNTLYLSKTTGPWTAVTPPTAVISGKGIAGNPSSAVNGVSSSGRAVGRRNGNNYVLDWNGTATPTPWNFNGLDGTFVGQAFSVSADGNTILGQSPKIGNANNFGYKATFLGQVQQSINPLPFLGNETGSTSLQVPYGCTTDGGIVVGMDYRGTEKAALWNTQDANPANWYGIDLTEYAAAHGILDGFTRLTRAYSVGVDAAGEYVVTGIGAWSPDGGVTPYVTRAFVLTVVPEPATLSLLVLGGLLLIRRRQ